MKLLKPLFILLALGFTLYLPGVTHADANDIYPRTQATLTLPVQQNDSPSPQMDIHMDALSGLSGWYRSNATVSAVAASGVANLEMRVDGGSWQSVDSIQLTKDGVHLVEIQGTDAAGNLAAISKEVKIDQHDPIGQFTAPPGGTAVQGAVQLYGTVHDELSGMGKVIVSLDDGKTWPVVPLHSDGSWSVAWDTRSTPDGRHALQAKFTDLAGNTSSAEIFYVVSNHPAQIHLTPRWYVWEKGKLDILPGDLALMDVAINISDPHGRWPEVHQDFSPNHTPKEIAWDGKFGQVQAPGGDYNVSVKVTDQMAQEVETHGVIVIPSVATQMATPSVTSTNPTRLWPIFLTGIGVLITIAWIAAHKSGIRPLRKLRNILLDMQHKPQK